MNEIESEFLVIRLRKLFSKLTYSESDVINIMIQSRKLLEAYQLQNQFKSFSFYCDWMVHSKLDRNVFCLGILEQLTRVLVEHSTYSQLEGNAWSNSLHKGIHLAIGIYSLNIEMMSFCNRFSVAANVINWKNFFTLLISSLVYTPIEIPVKEERTKKAREIFSSIMKICYNDPKKAVIRFQFADFTKVPEELPVSHISRSGYYWKLTTYANTHIQGGINFL